MSEEQVPTGGGRYRVVRGSSSGHCCFEASVVDMLSEGGHRNVAECFDPRRARQIADKLNGTFHGLQGVFTCPECGREYHGEPADDYVPLCCAGAWQRDEVLRRRSRPGPIVAELRVEGQLRKRWEFPSGAECEDYREQLLKQDDLKDIPWVFEEVQP